MDFFELLLLSPGQVAELINSNIFYLYAMPIFLVLESGVTYIYLKKIKTYPRATIKTNTVMTFWAYMLLKSFIFGPKYLFAYFNVQTDRPWDSAGGYMIIYYLYSVGVCFAFVAYLLNRHTSISSRKNWQGGENTSDGDVLEEAILYDVSEKIQAMYDYKPLSSGNPRDDISRYLVFINLALVSGIICLLSGGCDKYLGHTQVANHTTDNLGPWVSYQWAGLLALLAVPGSVYILRKHRKADLARFSPTNQEAGPETPAPQPAAEREPPRA